MDALSMLLEDVHLSQTEYFYVRGRGQWAFYLDKKDCIVFYLVIKGNVDLEVMEASRQVTASDIVMVPAGRNHVVRTSDDTNPSFLIADVKADNTMSMSRTSLDPMSQLVPLDIAAQFTPDGLQPIEIGQSEGEITELVVIICHYDQEITRPLLSALPQILPEHQGHEEQKMMVLAIGTKFLSIESAHNRLGKATMINRLASILMIECVRTYIEDLPDATDNWLKALKDPYLAKALAVMHDRPNDSWTIYKLAEIAGMSRSSFAEHFRQVVGVPPLTYLTDYRLRLAARYLRLQENSISRISELVGYASDSTFSQAFKRVYGMSPRKYRQQFRVVMDSDVLDS